MDKHPAGIARVAPVRTFLRYRLPGFLGHLVPRTHWTVYGDNEGRERVCIWKQWGNRCYDVLDLRTGATFTI